MNGATAKAEGPGPAVERVGVVLTVLYFALCVFAEPGPGTEVLVHSLFWLGAGIYLLGRAAGAGWTFRFTGVEVAALAFALLVAGSSALAVRRPGVWQIPAMAMALRHVTWMLALLLVADQCRAGHGRLWILALVGGTITRFAALYGGFSIAWESEFYDESLIPELLGIMVVGLLAGLGEDSRSLRARVAALLAVIPVLPAILAILQGIAAVFVAVAAYYLFAWAATRTWRPRGLLAMTLLLLLAAGGGASLQMALIAPDRHDVLDRMHAALKTIEKAPVLGHGGAQFGRMGTALLEMPQAIPGAVGNDLLDAAVAFGGAAALAWLATWLLALNRMAGGAKPAEPAEAWGRWSWMAVALLLPVAVCVAWGLTGSRTDLREMGIALIAAVGAGLLGWALLPALSSADRWVRAAFPAGVIAFLGLTVIFPGLFAVGLAAGCGFVVFAAIGVGLLARGRDVDAGRALPAILGAALVVFGLLLAGGAGLPWWRAERLTREAERHLEAALAARERAEYQTALDELDRAEEAAEPAIGRNPRIPDGYLVLARVRREQFALRTSHTDVAPEQIEEQSTRLLDAAWLAGKAEDLGRSAECAYEQGLAYRDLVEAFRRTGNEAGVRGHVPWTISAFRRAVDRHPAHPRYRFALARALDESGDLPQARRQYEEALRLDGLARDPTVKLLRGDADSARSRLNASP